MSTSHRKWQENSDTKLYVTEHEVRRLFDNLALNKAPGPDGICNKVLRRCKDQLAYVFTKLFQNSLDLVSVPTLLKTSLISPLPKSNKCFEFNDFTPISLMCNVMKCLEKFMLQLLMHHTGIHLDPLQFAYRKNRGVDDAVLNFLRGICQHLDVNRNFVKALFVDLSSTFNTIKPHILANQLMEMNVPLRLCFGSITFC